RSYFAPRLAFRAARQAHRKHRTLAVLAGHRHIAAHHARKLAGDSESEPCAAVLFRGRSLGLGKLLKQLVQLRGRHADAGIDDRELDDAAAVDDSARPQAHLAFFGELASCSCRSLAEESLGRVVVRSLRAPDFILLGYRAFISKSPVAAPA